MKTIMVDVDGVLFTYDTWKGMDNLGEPIQVNIDLVNALYDTGEYEICIWTTRTNDAVQGYPKKQLKEWLRLKLEEAGVRYHKICDENKPLFYLLLDDRTLNPLINLIDVLDNGQIRIEEDEYTWYYNSLFSSSLPNSPST